MAADFTIKQNDQLPELTVTLSDAQSQTIDLTSATSVLFIMNVKGSSVNKVNSAAEIVDADGGIVKYVWLEGDTDTAGNFTGEFQVTYSDDRIETFPNAKYIQIKVFADLGPTT